MRAISICIAIFWAHSLFSLEESAVDHYYAIAREACHDIYDVRRELNTINDEILYLLAKRTAYVKRAGDIKSATTKIAEDRQRVAAQEELLLQRASVLTQVASCTTS